MKTQFFTDILDEKEATSLYEYLRDNIVWEEGVRSKHGPTRLGKSIDLEDYPEIQNVIARFLQGKNYAIYGTYLNYYLDGNMWTPNHTHSKTHQLVISLGCERSFVLAKKTYKIKNGEGVLFGSSVHGIPKEPNVVGGRISIATFMTEIN